LISIIQPDDDDFHDYDLHVSEFAITAFLIATDYFV
jgi:hypothetical protein